MFRKLALKTALGALRGGGRLVAVHLIPDQITPWQTRKAISKTSSSFLTSVLQQLRKKPKKKKKPSLSFPIRKVSTQSFSGFAARPTSSRPVTRLAASPRLSTYSATKVLPKAPTKTTVARSAVSFLPRSSALVFPPSVVVRPQVPGRPLPQPHYQRNIWKSGGRLKSSTDWDQKDPAKRGSVSRIGRSAGSKTGVQRVALRRAHAKSRGSLDQYALEARSFHILDHS